LKRLASLRSLIVLALASLVASAGAAAPAQVFEYAQVHMGMLVRLRLYTAAEETARSAGASAFARIAELDRVMSDYRPDSEVRLIASNGKWTAVSRELVDVLQRALGVARATGGAFDPTVGPLVSIWRDARTARRVPDRAAIDAARTHVGWRHLHVDASRNAVRFAKPGMRLDLGGIAKGYILQDARRVLRTHGVAAVLREAGGDIVVGDAPPGRDGWTIDVGDAGGAFKARATKLKNAALATSGPTAQHLEIDGVRYSHVLDPRTGHAVTNDRVARVIAEDAATADALATALGVIGSADPRVLSRFPGVLVSLDSR
jgi:thiamine biosynthesis lipoprotein